MKLAAIAAFPLVGLAVAQTVHPIPTTQVRLVGEVPAEWWTNVMVDPSLSYALRASQYCAIRRIDPLSGLACSPSRFMGRERHGI